MKRMEMDYGQMTKIAKKNKPNLKKPLGKPTERWFKNWTSTP